MEVKAQNRLATHTSFAEFNEKYARIIEQSSAYSYQIQRLRQEDILFRTQSHEKLDNEPAPELGIGAGNLFISGSSAPICAKKEKRVAPKPFKAPLPKTRRNNQKKEKDSIPPLHGFGCTNMRYITESVLKHK